MRETDISAGSNMLHNMLFAQTLSHMALELLPFLLQQWLCRMKDDVQVTCLGAAGVCRFRCSTGSKTATSRAKLFTVAWDKKQLIYSIRVAVI